MNSFFHEFGSLVLGFIAGTGVFLASLLHIRSEKAKRHMQRREQQQDFAFAPTPVKNDETLHQSAKVRP